MIYESNLSCLKEKHNTIYEVIENNAFNWEEDNAFVDLAKNNDSIIAYRQNGVNIYLNSKYNPSREAEKYLEELQDIPEKAILTMYGLANGCFVKEALNKTNEEVLVVVYEPSISIFMQVMHHIDITDILNSGRLVLIVEGINTEYFDVVLCNALRPHNKNTSRHITLPKYVDIFPESYNNYAGRIQGAYDRQQLLSDTVMSVGNIVCKNNIMNLRYLPGCRCGTDFIDYFPADMPAIIVSAGPSLSKNKHLLKEAKGKALIIAVDTAITHVINEGIEPDMVITVDFDKDLKYFNSQGLDKIPFIIEPDSSHKALDKVKPKEVIFCGTDVLLWSEMIREQGKDLGFLNIGGSVATAAIATAISWKFKKIILIGQDLAFTGGSMHVGEGTMEYDFSTGRYSYIKGIDGEDLVTRADYLSYLRWIERTAYSNPDVEIIDATEGGALIEYTTVMTFRDAIDLYCNAEYDIRGLIDNVPQLYTDNGKAAVIEKLNAVKNNLQRMKRIFAEGSLESHKGSVMLSRGDFNVKELKRINAAMEKVDNMLCESAERELLSKLAANADNEFEEDMYETEADDIKESIRMYNKCDKYYRALADSVPELIEYIDLCIENFD